MNVPALAAKPPPGATQTMIGIRDSRIVPTISFVEVRAPPGVLSLITTAAAFRSPASRILSARYLAMPSSTIPVVGRTITSGPAPRTPEANIISAPSAMSASDTRGSRRGACCRSLVDTVVTTSRWSIAPPCGTTIGSRRPEGRRLEEVGRRSIGSPRTGRRASMRSVSR
jgi:hypothetical protein